MRARALILVVSLGAAGCGAPGSNDSGGGLSPDVAAGLAARAEQVAAALDAGACDDALAKARSLQTDIAALPLKPAVRAEALAGATRLVSGINCPVVTPPPVPVVPTSAPESKGDDDRKGKDQKGDKDDD